MSFSALNLTAPLLRALTQCGYQTPTPIQQKAIPAILAGQDILASAQTGTGKTAAFALPILHQLLNAADTGSTPATRALVLVPTRELAKQVHDSIAALSADTSLRCAMIYGGVCIATQAAILRAGVDIVVATPGRLLDHLRKRVLSLQQVRFLVFDEADRMLDMGFKDEIHDIVRQLPKVRQTLLFSATLNNSIYAFSKKLLNNPLRIEVDSANSTNADIEQRLYVVDTEKRAALLCHLMTQENWPQALVFSRTREGADSMAQAISLAGIDTRALHSDLTQKQREDILAEFSAGTLRTLIATDVAARGLDIDDLRYVVNLELPFQASDYVHRIGRTGRAGRTGLAITFYDESQARQLEAVEVMLDTRLPQQWYPGFEPDLTRYIETPVRRNAEKQRAKRRALGKKKR